MMDEFNGFFFEMEIWDVMCTGYVFSLHVSNEYFRKVNWKFGNRMKFL